MAAQRWKRRQTCSPEFEVVGRKVVAFAMHEHTQSSSNLIAAKDASAPNIAFDSSWDGTCWKSTFPLFSVSAATKQWSMKTCHQITYCQTRQGR
eukprot:218438-Rhodomonas_salina.2